MPPPGPFGPFEISRELEAGRGATVYRARKPGEPKGDYILKVFSLEHSLAGEDEQAIPELETLLADLGATFAKRINLQKSAAASSPYIVPVLADGQDERGAWYAAPYYARSVQGMLERLTALEAPDLYHILCSVTQAALHLKRTAGRSHGNLRPSNVFVEGLAKPRSSQVRVSDPLPGEAQEAAAYEKADLRAIGELLYQLVLKRRADFTWVIVPIEASAEWPRLFGKQSPRWVELCNRLLDPQLSLDNLNLERLEQELKRLRPPRQVLLPAAAACVATGLVLFLSYLLFGGLRVRVEPPGALVSLASGSEPPIEQRLGPKQRTASFRWPWRGATNLLEVEAPYHYKTNLSLYFAWSDFRKVQRVRLTRETVPLQVSADSTPGVAVWLGTNELGTTPGLKQLKLPVGLESKLIARFPDFPDDVRVFYPTNTRHLAAASFVFARNSLRVEFTGDPPFDRVVLKRNGRVLQEVNNIQSSTYTFKGLGPGRYSVEVRKRFYEPAQSLPVDVQSGASAQAQVALHQGSGKLQLRSNQPQVVYSLLDAEHKVVPLAQALQEGAAIPVPAGTNYVVASWKDWAPVTNLVVVEPGQSYDVAFRFSAGFLLVRALSPPDATLELLDQNAKPLPVPLSAGQAQPLKPGQYAVRARHEGYGDKTASVQLLAGETNAISLRLPRDVGTLVLSTHPALPGVKVTIQDTPEHGRPPWFVGALPETGQLSTNLPPGNYAVRAEYPGLDPLGFTFHLVKGARVSTNLDFQYWRLSLASEPLGAKVSLDGADIGHTPLTDRLVRRTGSNYFVLTLDQHYLPDVFWTNAPRAALLSIARQIRLRPKIPPLYTNSLGMVLAQIPDLPGGKDEGYMGMFEVSQAQYQELMRTNPSSDKARGPDLPVNYVTPASALDFCARLTAADTKLAALGGSFRYALPTEEQWHFCAANTPTTGAVLGAGLFQKSGPERIGTSPPNRLGLHDLLGNVSELCSLPGSDGSYHALGGNYQVSATFVSRNVIPVTKDASFIYVGFRVVLLPAP